MPSNGLKSSVDQLSHDNSAHYEGLLMNASNLSKQQQQQQFQALSIHNKNRIQYSIKNNRAEVFRKIQEAPIWVIFLTYFSYFNLFLFGCLRDFLRSIGLEKKKAANDNNPSVSVNAPLPFHSPKKKREKYFFSIRLYLFSFVKLKRILCRFFPNMNVFTCETCI